MQAEFIIFQIEKLTEKLNKAKEALRPMEEELEKLWDDHAISLSRHWIAKNGVTMDNIIRSNGPNVPYYGNVLNFGKWLKENNIDKKFCTWNDRIYFTEDIINGHMPRDAHGRYEHIKGAK